MNRKPIEIFAFICILAGIGVPFAIRVWEGGASAEYAILATAGDWLGGTSAPLFSLAGFLMMYGAYRMQQEDLRLTREEMQQTRKEFETQNSTLKRQEFETTFFHLLELHHQIVNGIVYTSPAKTLYQGRQYFSFVYRKLRQDYAEYYFQFYGLPTKNKLSLEEFDAECLQKVLSDTIPNIQNSLGHYFKNIFQTLRLLDKSILSDEEKIDFAKLLAAQLSPDELNILYYYCTYNDDDVKFQDLISRYVIFATMNKKDLLIPENLNFSDEN